MPTIVKELTIEATPKSVFNALTRPEEISCWWTNDLNVVKPEVGSLVEFRFGAWGAALRFEVVELDELDEESKVHWLHRLSPVPQWAGTSVIWQLTPVHNGTRLIFTHAGFAQADEIYEQSCEKWGSILDSLKSYLETGKGTPGIPPFVW